MTEGKATGILGNSTVKSEFMVVGVGVGGWRGGERMGASRIGHISGDVSVHEIHVLKYLPIVPTNASNPFVNSRSKAITCLPTTTSVVLNKAFLVLRQHWKISHF